MADFVGYYRVSTQAQGRSGLGLDAQKDAVANYVAGVGGTLVAEFREVESGSASAARPQLFAALAHCRAKRAVLVIAKLDRLARNVRFISELIESGIEFVIADMPTATKLTVHIIAAMAEYERDAISQRTKSALRAAKARGVVLGNPNAARQSKKAASANKARADAFAKKMLPMIETLRASGITSYSRLAIALECNGVKTQRGGLWSPSGVRNIVLRGTKLTAIENAGSPRQKRPPGRSPTLG